MKTTTVGEVQKNFSRILRNIWAGEKIVVTKRGKTGRQNRGFRAEK